MEMRRFGRRTDARASADRVTRLQRVVGRVCVGEVGVVVGEFVHEFWFWGAGAGFVEEVEGQEEGEQEGEGEAEG